MHRSLLVGIDTVKTQLRSTQRELEASSREELDNSWNSAALGVLDCRRASQPTSGARSTASPPTAAAVALELGPGTACSEQLRRSGAPPRMLG